MHHHNKLRYKILYTFFGGNRRMTRSLLIVVCFSVMLAIDLPSMVNGTRYNHQNRVKYFASGGSSSGISSNNGGGGGGGDGDGGMTGAIPKESLFGNNLGRHAKHGLSNTNGNSNSNSNSNNNNDVYSVADSQAMTDDYLANIGLNTNANTLIVNQQQLSSCQTVCACKWKGGKQTVECIDRLLIQIPENIDPSTQVLDMSGNKLQTLSNEQFIRANLLNLQKLYLRSCNIGEIEPETFKGLTNLVELDLSHNLLVVVPSDALSFIPSLRELTLASNHIHKIEAMSFASTPALHKLDLSHCDIQTIAPQAFEGLEGMTLLRLNGNKLSELRTKTIETLSRLHGIELHDNPWICDCRLRAAKLWLTQRNIPYPVVPICAGGPERVLDRTFADLQLDDFACRPEMLPISHYVEATMGENASIVCRASAVPTATINWYWNGRLLSNGSAFSSFQRVHVYEDVKNQFEKRSRLILTNSQETDSSEFYCVAENRAGTAEANFTLHVSMRAAGMASLGSNQIVGLSATILVLIVLFFLIIMFVTLRLRRTPFIESKTPNHLEVVTTVNHPNHTISNKTQQSTGNGNIGGIVIANGAIPNCIDTNTIERKSGHNRQQHDNDDDSGFTNPVQKPPRLTDLAYTINNYDNNGSVLSTASCFISPTASAGNNPDLINDTKRFGSDEFTDLRIPAILTANLGDGSSGEYSRAGGCDSLYPSGLWETGTGNQYANEELYMKRATSTTITGYSAYTEKTPIIESNRLYDLHERSSDYFSKTFPRTHFNTNSTTAGAGNGCAANHPSTSSAMMSMGVGVGNSTTSTTTTNLSTSSCGVGGGGGGGGSGSGSNSGCGYPSDYGLPLVPGAEQQHHHHLQMHPLQQLHQQYSSNNNSSTTILGQSQNHPLTSSTAISHNSCNSNSTSHINNNNFSRNSSMSGSSSVTATARNTPTPPPPSTAAAAATATSISILPNGMPVNAKTIRVWQKGGVPVLPPVSALKRALISSSRNSPDEGYQEGCGTDV